MAEVEEEKSLTDFLIDVALLTDADSEKEEDKNKITLMTIHAAKGLEFPYVYIVGMEENLFPSQMALNSRNELEEERRLFYVALTRAKKKATLSYAVSRYRWGNFTSCEPSRFIDEINDKYIEKTNFSNESLSSFSKKTSGSVVFKFRAAASLPPIYCVPSLGPIFPLSKPLSILLGT